MRYSTTRTTTTTSSPVGIQNENSIAVDRGMGATAGNGAADRRHYDRGTKAWLVVLTAFLVQMLIFAVRGTLLEEWTRAGLNENEKYMFDYARSFMFLVGPFAAFLIRWIKTMYSMLVSAVLSVAACLIALHAIDDKSVAVFCGILLGMGLGIAFICCYAVLLDYFRRYLGVAAVIVTVGCGFGEVLGPLFYKGLPDFYVPYSHSGAAFSQAFGNKQVLNAGLLLNLIVAAIVFKPRSNVGLGGFKSSSWGLFGINILGIANFVAFLLHLLLMSWGVMMIVLAANYIHTSGTDQVVNTVHKSADNSTITTATTVATTTVNGSRTVFFDENGNARNTLNALGFAILAGQLIAVAFELFVEPVGMYAGATILLGVFQLFMVLGNTREGFLTLATGAGLMQGFLQCFFVPTIGHVAGYGSLVSALGFTGFIQGIGALIGGLILRAVFEGASAGDGIKPEHMLVLGGCFVFVAGCIMVIVAYKNHRDHPEQLLLDNVAVDERGHLTRRFFAKAR
ncbi:hypothetical protein RvY_10398 [Ramazzottius varieornatus]|uniref:Major facilitator superfamily (MFS) profile domain-containing protein n=1 Tax=Ramazzottius varieornatus TaxID=947166 RepID=A0A1D1VH34_RAMVA|nr:hypothetical protein RvY_10398 [Ramazzottius varieornatus]